MISAAQAETILDLYDLLDIGEHDQEAALHRRGVESLDQLTAEHAADMIAKLEVIKYRRGL